MMVVFGPNQTWFSARTGRGFQPEPDVVFSPNQTNHVVRSAKFGPEGRTMHSPG